VHPLSILAPLIAAIGVVVSCNVFADHRCAAIISAHVVAIQLAAALWAENGGSNGLIKIYKSIGLVGLLYFGYQFCILLSECQCE
jgi:hypothetical protein